MNTPLATFPIDTSLLERLKTMAAAIPAVAITVLRRDGRATTRG